MLEAYQVHAIIQVLAFLSFLLAVYSAKKHNVRIHHKLVCTAVVLNTLAVALMLYDAGGLPTIHGRIGFSIYLLILITTMSGKLFLNNKLKKNNHRVLAVVAISLLLFMILHGLITFVLM